MYVCLFFNKSFIFFLAKYKEMTGLILTRPPELTLAYVTDFLTANWMSWDRRSLTWREPEMNA